MPEPWKLLEIEYGRRIRAAGRAERRALYAEANSEVAKLRLASLPNEPEARTAGTSPALVRFLIRRCSPGDTVLEVGCGTGYTCWKLAPHVRRIIGTDISEPRLREAEALLRLHDVRNAEVRAVFADELVAAFGPESFDRVISVDVYEHLHPEEGAAHLKEVWSVLRPGGVYIAITANRLVGPTDITRDVFPGAAEARGFHFNETTHEELARALREAGFSSVRCAWRAPKALPIVFHVPIPLPWMIAFEHACARLGARFRRVFKPLLTINAIARK
jgi:SAM-dependent methyltransferase